MITTDSIAATVTARDVDAELGALEAEKAELLATVVGHEVTIKELLASADQLSSKLTRVEGDLCASRENHRKDIAFIGEALLDEAARREWCREFDEFAGRLNRELHERLPLRPRLYVATVEITVTTADDDEARDRVHSLLSEVDDYCITGIEEPD